MKDKICHFMAAAPSQRLEEERPDGALLRTRTAAVRAGTWDGFGSWATSEVKTKS